MNRKTLVLGALLALLPAVSHAALFVLVDGIAGNVSQVPYQGWHNADAFDWSFERSNATSPFRLHITMTQNSSNIATIRQVAFNGTPLKKIVIDLAHQISAGNPMPITRLTCEGATITVIAVSANANDIPKAQLQLGCAKLLWEDFEYGPNGNFLKSVKGEASLLSK